MLARIVFLVNAVATAAAGFVLFVHPQLIGAAVNIHLTPSENFVYFLLGGSELGLSYLFFVAAWTHDASLRSVAATAGIVFHVFSGIAGIEAVVQGTSVTALWNVGLRVIMAVLFGVILINDRSKPNAENVR